MFCPHCGGENRADSKFCMRCGAALRPPAPPHSASGAGAPQPAVPVSPLPVALPRPAAAASKQRRVPVRRLWLVLALFVLLALGVSAFLLFGDAALATLRGSGDGLLVAFPSRSGRAELYLLSAGQSVEEGTLLMSHKVLWQKRLADCR